MVFALDALTPLDSSGIEINKKQAAEQIGGGLRFAARHPWPVPVGC